MKRASWWCVAAVVCALAVRAEDANVQTVSGFRVPQYDDNNNLKSQLFGDFAKILPDGVIEITQLKIDFYSKGVVAMTVTAPYCAYHQKEGMAKSDSEVRIARENMVVTGVGFAYNGDDETFEILSQAKVVLKQAEKAIQTGVNE